MFEATENLKTNSDRLSRTKDIHGLKQGSDAGSRKKSALRKSSLNHSQVLLVFTAKSDGENLDRTVKKMSGDYLNIPKS